MIVLIIQLYVKEYGIMKESRVSLFTECLLVLYISVLKQWLNCCCVVV